LQTTALSKSKNRYNSADRTAPQCALRSRLAAPAADPVHFLQQREQAPELVPVCYAVPVQFLLQLLVEVEEVETIPPV
jgi:hypothetical protein